MLPQRLRNATYAGTAVMFFTAVNLIKLPPYVMLGSSTRPILNTVAVLLPLAPMAIGLGIWLTRSVRQEPPSCVVPTCSGLGSA